MLFNYAEQVSRTVNWWHGRACSVKLLFLPRSALPSITKTTQPINVIVYDVWEHWATDIVVCSEVLYYVVSFSVSKTFFLKYDLIVLQHLPSSYQTQSHVFDATLAYLWRLNETVCKHVKLYITFNVWISLYCILHCFCQPKYAHTFNQMPFYLSSHSKRFRKNKW